MFTLHIMTLKHNAKMKQMFEAIKAEMVQPYAERDHIILRCIKREEERVLAYENELREFMKLVREYI